MSLKVITAASELNKGTYNTYISQLSKAGIETEHHWIKNFNWATRLSKYFDVACKYSEEMLIFTDAWDVLFFPGNGVIEIPHPTDKILFGAEKNVWPPGTEHGPLKGAKVPNLFINAGMFMATGKVLARFMDAFNMQYLREGIDDQALWHKVADTEEGQAMLRLDGKCEIFQNLYMAEEDVEMVNGRIHNKVFDTYPMFLHGNGKVPLDRFLV